MSCPKEEVLLKLFNNVSSTSFQLLFLIIFSSSIFLVTFLTFTGRFPLIQRDQHHEYVYSDDDDEEDHSCVGSTEREVIRGKKLFVDKEERQSTNSYSEEFISPRESLIEENHYSDTLSLPQVSDMDNEEEFLSRDDYAQLESTSTSPINLNLYKSSKNCKDDHVGLRMIENKKVREPSLTRDEKFFVFSSKRLVVDEESDDDSMCSSSIPSGTEDELSSTSSRRSCPKWESYTSFQKYDEERTFLDRISAQKKLHETESLRSIQMSPRSISERTVNKFSSMNKKPVDVGHNPFCELEAAYVAQVCLTWEALSSNYKNFRSKHASQLLHHLDTSCPATIAKQFQQFQALLQRYIENEPYEHGRRPEIYARMRLLAPKLLLVPEYQDADGNQKESDFHNKISSASFLKIMEDGIRTFMNFLKTDKENPCQILADYFKRNRRGMVDPTLLRLMKKVNQKKRLKVKDLRHSGKGLRKKKVKGRRRDGAFNGFNRPKSGVKSFKNE